MLIVLSPAKTLNFSDHLSLAKNLNETVPEYFKDAVYLAEHFSQFSSDELSRLMNISTKLAELNHARFKNWERELSLVRNRQAILAFNGDVYLGLQAATLSDDSLHFAQKHLRILSGIYGILKPFDLIQPYRLEMGLRVEIDNHRNLYDFWQSKITNSLNRIVDDLSLENCSSVLINLASNEYFKAIDSNQSKVPIITPVFEDFKGGAFKIISFYAKRARGLMARYILEKKITQPECLKQFFREGYSFDRDASTKLRWVFRR